MNDALIREIIARAKSVFDAGKMDEARVILESGHHQHPRDASILNFLAYLSYRQGHLERARDLYRILTGLEPSNLAVWSNLGLIEYKLGLLDEARASFQEYLRQKPDDPKVVEYLSLVLKKLGREAVALTPEGRPRLPATPAGGEEASAPEAEDHGQVPVGSATVGAAPPSPPPRPEAPTPLQWISWRVSPPEDHWDAVETTPALVGLAPTQGVVFALTSLAAYQGRLTFEQGVNPYGKIPRSFRDDALVLLSARGEGTLWLAHAGGRLAEWSLDGEDLGVNAHFLAGFEGEIKATMLPLGKERFLPGLAALDLGGAGRVAVSVGNGPLLHPLSPGESLRVAPRHLVAWIGDCRLAVDGGEDFRKVRNLVEEPLVRVDGEGWVVLHAQGGAGTIS
jgi:uncharacterized protein (AIM24 family)